MSGKKIPDIESFGKNTIVISALRRREMPLEELKAFLNESTGGFKIGLSHFFGEIDVPENFEWPYFEDKDTHEKYPLECIAQLDMAEVSQYDKSGLLPKTGYMYFFMDMGYYGGYEACDYGYGRVFYYDVDKSELKRVKDEYSEYPLERRMFHLHIFNITSATRYLTFSSVTDYPTEPQFVDHSIMQFSEANHIWDYLPFIGENNNYLSYDEHSWGSVAKMLGYEELLQYSEFDTCEKIYQELYGESGREWLVLLQYGAYLFYIKKEDLLNKRFDRVWVMSVPID